MLSPLRILRRYGGPRRVGLIAICIVSIFVLAQNVVFSSSYSSTVYGSEDFSPPGDTQSEEHAKQQAVNVKSLSINTQSHVDDDRPVTRSTRRPPSRSANFTRGSNIAVADKNIVYGDKLTLCGAATCPSEAHIPMSFYSGKNHEDEPKLCVDGRFVIARDLNKAGRGVNIVVIEPSSRRVLRVAHFDTYAEDSSALEIFLEQIGPDQLVAVVSFDEASTKLTTLAKQLFYDLGSGLVQNMKFRASWYFVGQSGITGFTPFEELNYAHNAEWAKPIDVRICVPPKLDGVAAHVDRMPVAENKARRAFCKKYDGYEEFCDDSHIDEALTVAPPIAKQQSMVVPILIIAGLSHNSLRLCLETVLRQPAVDKSLVFVVYDENYMESGALAELFGFKHGKVNTTSSYMAQYNMALELAFVQFPKAMEMIVIEEELLLTIDFVHFINSLLTVLREDKDVFAVSAWNDNSFKSSAHLPELAYRTSRNTSSLLAFMIRRDTYEKFMKNTDCCSRRSWQTWKFADDASSVVIVPDTSRVLRRSADGLAGLATDVQALFGRPRAFVREHTAELALKTNLASTTLYDAHLRALISTGRPMDHTNVTALCKNASNYNEATTNALQVPKALHKLQATVLYFTDTALTWTRLRACFGVLHDKPLDGDDVGKDSTLNEQGVYKGTLRFSHAPSAPVIMVSSSSPHFTLKPAAIVPIEFVS